MQPFSFVLAMILFSIFLKWKHRTKMPVAAFYEVGVLRVAFFCRQGFEIRKRHCLFACSFADRTFE
jgi:hypothetical protein